jgi:hypothetical protein
VTGAPSAAPSRPDGPLSPTYRLVTLGIVGQITLIAFEALAVSTAMPVVATDLGSRSTRPRGRCRAGSSS